ncbi:hypothetical protein [Lacticaseibacillus songhuajiangensis]|uniref:hypothetical protein n=1 Tax=Lacticaseibacillus songhuajiangensis TaxID=1296539 RepID=UPI0013DE0708|nr:hypothetical protein [Lacticaseibacillus songhuajiangensis]
MAAATARFSTVPDTANIVRPRKVRGFGEMQTDILNLIVDNIDGDVGAFSYDRYDLVPDTPYFLVKLITKKTNIAENNDGERVLRRKEMRKFQEATRMFMTKHENEMEAIYEATNNSALKLIPPYVSAFIEAVQAFEIPGEVELDGIDLLGVWPGFTAKKKTPSLLRQNFDDDLDARLDDHLKGMN